MTTARGAGERERVRELADWFDVRLQEILASDEPYTQFVRVPQHLGYEVASLLRRLAAAPATDREAIRCAVRKHHGATERTEKDTGYPYFVCECGFPCHVGYNREQAIDALVEHVTSELLRVLASGRAGEDGR